MGTSVVRTLNPTQVQQLQNTTTGIGQSGSGARPGLFIFFAAFDGTNNDRNNVGLSGNPHPTNVLVQLSIAQATTNTVANTEPNDAADYSYSHLLYTTGCHLTPKQETQLARSLDGLRLGGTGALQFIA